MALPNGSGGYQVGDGNLNELRLGYNAAPLSVASTATLTAAQVTAGILLVSSGSSSAETYTLPVASATNGVDSILSSAKVGSTFSLNVVNLGSNTAALAMGSSTGFTDGGNAVATIAATSSAWYLFRKTAEGAWSVYKVA